MMKMLYLHISPSGSDSNPGTPSRPLASLKGARDAVRGLLAEGKQEDIRIEFHGGIYPVWETVVFDVRDSARSGQTITYGAAEGASPVFSAAIGIKDWRKLQPPWPEGLPETSAPIWSAPLPEGVNSFRVLYDGHEPLTRAAEPYFDHFTPTDPSWRFTGTEEEHRVVIAPPGRGKDWPNRDDVEVVIRGMALWNMNILGIESIDVEKSTFRLDRPTTYVIARPGGYILENTFRGLDGPGKWVLDSKARRIYFWPPGDEPGDEIAAPCLVEMVRVEGRIDYEGPRDEPVRGLVFQGLTFQHNDRPVMRGGRSGWGLQHDWEDFDAPTAMLRLRGTEDCMIRECRLIQGGSTGIRLDLHAHRNRIVENEISGLGGVGILLAGYGPGTKNVNRGNEISGNWIHHIGRLFWHSPGIFIWQSGENLIRGNRLHDLPYSALVVSGRIKWDPSGVSECSRTVRWHEVGALNGKADWKDREPLLHGRNNRIEANDISGVMKILGDGNGIYISGTGGGNEVIGNFIHDCLSKHFGECIRCDDDQHETLISQNLCVRFGGMATGICSKGVNHIVNNIIAYPLTPTQRGLIAMELTPCAGSRIQGNILYATRKDQAFYYIDTYYPGTQPPHIRDLEVESNLYFNSADEQAGDKHLAMARSWGKELNSLSADPLFVDAEQDDYRLKPGSPAIELGIDELAIPPHGMEP